MVKAALKPLMAITGFFRLSINLPAFNQFKGIPYLIGKGATLFAIAFIKHEVVTGRR
jgi:hypothetical protein